MTNGETQLLIKADLFIKASNNVENAKNLFKECKRTIDESNVVFGASLFSQLEQKINDSDKAITNLINRIENTKKSLLELDSDFANEYMTILAEQLKNSSLDTSTMTEEERNEYNQKMNNTIKDYNFNLYYMLERLQKNGQLTPEIEEMIEQEYGINYKYQKAVCDQYKIQDQMSGVDVLSDDFKSLYKEYIEQGKNVILFDPKLDENTKQTRLNELEIQYNETIKSIDESQKARTQARQQEQLQKLQLQKEYNNGLFHPGVEKEIDDAIINLRAEMGDQSAIDYLNMSDFEKGLQYAGTVCFSAFEGFLDLGEGLVDGVVYLGGKTVQVASFGSVDDKWAEDIISYDVSGNLYDWTVDAVGINSEIAYGSARSIGNFVGGGLGYYALSAVPYVGPALCALAGAGKKTEENMIHQLETTGEIDDGKVLLNFALGAAEGYGAGKAAGSMREGVKNLSQIKGTLSKDGFKATMSSAGDIAKNAAVKTFTKDIDTWIETAAVVADDIYTGFETGEWNWGKMFFEASGVIGQNFIGNFGAEAMGNYQKQLASQKADWNADLEAMTPEQRSKYWEDYFSSQYGADNITKTSGIDVDGHNGSFVDPDAKRINEVLNITQGQGSYKNLDEFCASEGITVEKYRELTRTKTHQLTSEQRRLVYRIDKKCYGDVLNLDGTLKDGTEIVKYVAPADFEGKPWYAEGVKSRATGCVALSRDAGKLSVDDAISKLGLDYENSMFYENGDVVSGKTVDYCYRIIGESTSPMVDGAQQSRVTMRVSSTTDYVPPYETYDLYGQQIMSEMDAKRLANDTWTANSQKGVSGLQSDSGCKYITVENPNAGYNSANQPDTGTGVTKNRSDSNALGCLELNASQSDLISDGNYNYYTNGRVEKVYADGRIEVEFIIDKNGYFRKP